MIKHNCVFRLWLPLLIPPQHYHLFQNRNSLDRRHNNQSSRHKHATTHTFSTKIKLQQPPPAPAITFISSDETYKIPVLYLPPTFTAIRDLHRLLPTLNNPSPTRTQVHLKAVNHVSTLHTDHQRFQSADLKTHPCDNQLHAQMKLISTTYSAEVSHSPQQSPTTSSCPSSAPSHPLHIRDCESDERAYLHQYYR